MRGTRHLGLISWCSTCLMLPPRSRSRPGWPLPDSTRWRRLTTGTLTEALPTGTQTGGKWCSRPGSTARLPDTHVMRRSLGGDEDQGAEEPTNVCDHGRCARRVARSDTETGLIGLALSARSCPIRALRRVVARSE